MTQESASDQHTAPLPQVYIACQENKPAPQATQHDPPSLLSYTESDLRTIARLKVNADGYDWIYASRKSVKDFLNGDASATNGMLAELGFARVIVKVKP